VPVRSRDSNAFGRTGCVRVDVALCAGTMD
jgi:hypothetical protein